MIDFLKKLKSRKFLLSLWAVILISYIVITNKVEFIPVAELLLLIPISYIPTNAYQKKLFSKKLTGDEIN